MSSRSSSSTSSTLNGAPPTRGQLPHAPSSSPPLHPPSDIAHSTSRAYSYDPVTEHPEPSPITHPAIASSSSRTAHSPLNTPSLLFDPPEYIVVKIIHDLASADASLRMIANAAQTSVDALTLWMSRPDIDARLNALESAFARKTRITVANRTEAILSTCTRILDEYQYAESHFLTDGSSVRGLTLQIKNRQTALQACRIIMRLNNTARPFHPSTRPPISPTPAPPAPTRAPLASSPLPTSDIAHPPSDIPFDLVARRAARFPANPEAQASDTPLCPPPNEPDAQARVPSHSPAAHPAPAPTAAPTPAHKYPAGPAENSASPSSHPSSPPPLHASTSLLSLPILHTNGKSHNGKAHKNGTAKHSRPP